MKVRERIVNIFDLPLPSVHLMDFVEKEMGDAPFFRYFRQLYKGMVSEP